MKRTFSPLFLTNSPLIFVLSQVRFEPILNMQKRIPEIQDELRKEGFTGYLEKTLEVEFLDAASKQIEVKRIPQWEFCDAAKRASIIIDQSFVACQTSAYSKYEDFERFQAMAVRVVEKHAAPRECHRVGLRYVDRILPRDSKSFSWYVNSGLLGANLTKFGKRLGHVTESLIEIGGKRRFKVRYTEAVKGLAFPVDLLPLSIELPASSNQQSPFAILDMDHFDTTQEGFNSEKVIERIADLHDLLDQTFRELVTENALNEWK